MVTNGGKGRKQGMLFCFVLVVGGYRWLVMCGDGSRIVESSVSQIVWQLTGLIVE